MGGGKGAGVGEGVAAGAGGVCELEREGDCEAKKVRGCKTNIDVSRVMIRVMDCMGRTFGLFSGLDFKETISG